MKILLLTTLPNQVYECLSAMPDIDVEAIDFADTMSRQTLYHIVRGMLNHDSYDMLLTYRCPYIIPGDIYERFAIRLNIHPLPLPEYAGLNPWELFLKSGNRRAETVLHKITTKPDCGEMVCREQYEITIPDKARETADKTAARMIKNYLETLV